MVGGAGNDTYFVDNPSDAVFEIAGEGDDAVFSTAHYRLAANVETLVLQGSANLQGYGNTGQTRSTVTPATICSTASGGADRMVGGTGNDTYFVDNIADIVLENPNDGTDAVFSTIDYTLSVNVETLVLQGAGDLAGTGNALANGLFGNSGDNSLDGGSVVRTCSRAMPATTPSCSMSGKPTATPLSTSPATAWGPGIG